MSDSKKSSVTSITSHDENGIPWAVDHELQMPLGSHIAAPLPDDEAIRIETLRQYEILDSIRTDPVFQSFTEMIANSLGTEIALISLVDTHRQWFKSAVGLDVPETTRDLSFCAWGILPPVQSEPEVFVVENALKDRRFAGSNLVLGEPHIRFYAGVPLVGENMCRLGSLCAISKSPRVLKPHEHRLLVSVGDMVMRELDLRRREGVPSIACTEKSVRSRKIMQRVSHQIRTPIHNISGHLELLDRSNLTKEQTQLLQAIDASLLGLKGVVNTLFNPAEDQTDKKVLTLGKSELEQATNAEATLLEAEMALRAQKKKTMKSKVKKVKRDKAEVLLEKELQRRLAGKRILIVDDIAMNLLLLRKMIEKIAGGAGVVTLVEAVNGAEAVECVAAAGEAGAPFDMVFLDLQMPVMCGIEAAENIVKWSEAQEGRVCPPLVALTADSTFGVRSRCYHAGFLNYLAKPASVADIVSATVDALDGARPLHDQVMSDSSDMPLNRCSVDSSVPDSEMGLPVEGPSATG